MLPQLATPFLLRDKLKENVARITGLKLLLHVTIFLCNFPRKKKLLQVAHTILRVTPPPATESVKLINELNFKFHLKLNRFLLSTTNFFKLHNKNTCNMALVTCFATLFKSINGGRCVIFQFTQLFSREKLHDNCNV